MRKTCLNEIYNLARRDKRVVFIGSDLGAGTLDQLKKEMPEQFIMEGVSEANIVGLAAGLAMNGKIPYVNTIATFLTRRCYEQIVIDLALHKLNVRLIGSGGGFVYAPLGPTHISIDDIVLMRTVPHMTVVVPADGLEMEKLMPQTLDYPGPIYIRLAKGGDEIVTPENSSFTIGRGRIVKSGKDILIVTTGITLQVAIEALPILQKKNIDAGIVHMPTIKPIDRRLLVKLTKSVHGIITVEEGLRSGGLGSAVAEIITEIKSKSSLPILRIGFPDTFPEKYGSQSELLSYYGITAAKIVTAARQIWEN